MVLVVIGICPFSANAAVEWEKKEISVIARPEATSTSVTFKFVNRGSTPLTLRSIRTSCSCNVATMDSKAYAPGEAGEVQVIFSHGQRTGDQTSTVQVSTSDKDSDAVLSLKVQIPLLYTLQPSFLTWKPEEGLRPKTVELTFHDQLPVTVTAITSTDPDFTHQLETLKAGASYRITITPVSPAAKTRSFLKSSFSIQTDLKVAGKDKLSLYAFAPLGKDTHSTTAPAAAADKTMPDSDAGPTPYAARPRAKAALSSLSDSGINLHLGDVDDDAVVTVRDVALVIEHVKGASPLDEHHAVLADVTKDGAVNQADVDELIKEVLETRTPEALPLSAVRFTSPAAGEGDVAVTRETILHFTVPLAINATLDTTQFHADFAGRKLLSRVEISSDRKKATLFYLEPLPANARVKVTLDASALTDLIGRPVDADGDGVEGGAYHMSFDTHTNSGVPATGIVGRVVKAAEAGVAFAGNGAEADGEEGIPGVTITVDGAEEVIRAVTDAQGWFTLAPCPTGTFFVHIDGRTSPHSHYPESDYFPAVGKQWEAVAGKMDNPAGGTGIVYLPQISPATLQPVSQTATTSVTFPPSVLAASPLLAGTQFIVPENSLFSDDGTRGGLVGIAPVPFDRLPSPLPPGLTLPLVVTVQSDGATNFDRPAPIVLPNLPDPVTGLKLSPGDKTALWSFNHDTGQWEVVGPMTVTEDGNFARTDAGVGIRQPGWHGNMPGCQGTLPPPRKLPENPDKCEYDSWQAAGIALKALDAAWSCVKVLGPAKLKYLQGIACAASAVKGIKAIYDDIDKAARLIRKLSADGLATDNVAQIEAAIAFLDAADRGCQSFESDKLCFDRNSPANIFGDLLGCVGGILGVLDSICNLDGGDCVNDWILRNICPGVATVKSWIDYAKRAEEGIKKWQGKLFGFNACITISATKSYYTLLLLKERSRLPGAASKVAAGATATNAGEEKTFEEIKAEALLSSQSILDYGSELQAEFQSFSEQGQLPMDVDSQLSSIGSVLDLALTQTNSIPLRSSCYYWVELEGSDLRGRSSRLGEQALVLPPNAYYTVHLYHHGQRLIGTVNGKTQSSGTSFALPQVFLESSATNLDSDGDQLCDEAEKIVGTNLDSPDSDNDGVFDGAEIDNGTDPLSGIASATGIVGKAEVASGDCRDVAAVNDVLAAAFGSEGLQLLGVRQGLSPTKLSKVATPAPANVVAMTGSLVAVGMGAGGTMIVDASTADTPQILRTIKLGSSVKSLAAVENTVYIGFEDGRLVAVDMLSGRLIASVNLGAAVHDIAIGAGVLYAATADSLKTLPVSTAGAFGSITSTPMTGNLGAVRFRLFRSSSRLYSVFTQGFHVFDIASPGAPTLLQTNTTNQFGWRHLVASDSRLAVAIVGINNSDDAPHDVSIYDLGANGTLAGFTTTFSMPSHAFGAVMYNGLAYVASGTAGIQVVNIRPFDTLKVPPAITLNVASIGGAVVEGGFASVSALVTDDVQVRNVEFYVDGVKVETDGNFPFEGRLLAPRIGPGKTTAVFRAKATDTGGNFAWSNEITLNLSTEITPPTVLAMTPPNGQFLTQCAGFTLKFSEPVKTVTLNSSTIRFYVAGADGRIGTDDDIAVPATLLAAASGSGTYRDTASWQAAAPLPPGIYRVLATLGVQDTAGNALATPFSGVFTVSGGSDSDGDGLADDVEIALGYNPENQDSNGNGKADGDEDFDGDSLSNALELRYGLQPNNTDSNANGIADNVEDADKDTLTTAQEFAAGSDPTKPDTDGDGWPDQIEVQFVSNPADARSKPITFFVGTPGNYAITQEGNFAAPALNMGVAGGETTVASPQTNVRIGSAP